jgi:hypothetical protein
MKNGTERDAARTSHRIKVSFGGIGWFPRMGNQSNTAALQQAQPQKPLPQIRGPKTFAME